MRSFPELFAVANGAKCDGPFPCVYCGAPASQEYELSKSFTTRDTLARPGSKHACAGCLLCLEESGTAVYHTGERYEFRVSFRRMCSWVVTREKTVAATKGHIEYLRGVCLDPPDPPFGISIAVSGQKHVLYRGVVSHSREFVSLTLEGERVDYRPDQLRERLLLCGKLVAATGKPALVEPLSQGFWNRVADRFSSGESLCELWSHVREEPLSRLSAFLCPNKEICERLYPGDRHGGIPPAGGEADRPEPQDGGGRGRRHEGTRQATLFGDV